MKEWIVGRNPVYEALRAGRRHIFQLRVADGAQEKGRLAEILQLCSRKKLPVQRVKRGQLDGFGSGNQGVALEVSGYPFLEIIDP